ncbi:MAG: MFS transporter [Clostridia bacterium]|nr:MFS transporter [Clostridia bacterium]
MNKTRTPISENYNHTIYASYIGYITQAIVNNFAPLLFLTFSNQFSLSLDKITLITTINFAVQLAVDLISAKLIDKIGYRISIVAAHVFAAAGLIGLSVLPWIFSNQYIGIIISVVLYAIGGGLTEVLISPIVEACPVERKEGSISLLHSFYCWGQFGVILLSTLFFTVFGIEHWRILSLIWAAVPIANCIYFSKVPLFSVSKGAEPARISQLFKNKLFWLILLLMLCAGASELAMAQWASAFAESALHVSKAVGDLAGPCAFALLMGTARALYGKFSDRLPLKKVIMWCAALCIASYLLASLTSLPVFGLIGCAVCGFSVGIFWPGTFSLAAASIPAAGTAMYAFMALAGDMGCMGGPTLVGLSANALGGNLKIGLLSAVIFPIIILVGSFLLDRKKA